jgi:hypothetical protein
MLERGAGNDAKTDEGVTIHSLSQHACQPPEPRNSAYNANISERVLHFRRFCRRNPTRMSGRAFGLPESGNKVNARCGIAPARCAKPVLERSGTIRARSSCTARGAEPPRGPVRDSQSGGSRFFGTHRSSTRDHARVEDWPSERFVKLLRPCQRLAHSPRSSKLETRLSRNEKQKPSSEIRLRDSEIV